MKYLLLLLLLPLGNCKSRQDYALSETPDSEFASSDEKVAWIEKAARALRAGQGLGNSDDVPKLLSMTSDQILETFMADDRFVETVINANLWFLGRNIQNTVTYGTSNSPLNEDGNFGGGEFGQNTNGNAGGGFEGGFGNGAVEFDENGQPIQKVGPKEKFFTNLLFEFPQVLASTIAVLEGDGDYFQLISGNPTLYIPPLRFPNGVPRPNDLLKSIPAAEASSMANLFRKQQLRAYTSLFDNLVNSSQSKDDLCRDAFPDASQSNPNFGGSNFFTRDLSLQSSGFPMQMDKALGGSWFKKIQLACNAPKTSFMAVRGLIVALKKNMQKIFTAVETTPITTGKFPDLKSLVALENFDPTLGPIVSPFNGTQWRALPNSSTNVNRKRAGYALKTYFCDDLTALDVVSPPSHVKNKHATDPNCRSCHYKLDPMAGLFRFHGREGSLVNEQIGISFDDNKQLNGEQFSDYISSNWVVGESLQVGYFSSPLKPHAQWQGDRLEHLWPFLRNHEPTRQCIVQRLAEFYLGPDQVYDPDWLKEISADFRPGSGSGNQYKTLVKSLVKSKTFKKHDPIAGECYDLKAGAKKSSLPCSVRSIIDKNCKKCHTTTENRIRLTEFNPTRGFLHLGDTDQPLDFMASSQLILERVNATHSSSVMPPSGQLQDTLRQSLYNWITDERSRREKK